MSGFLKRGSKPQTIAVGIIAACAVAFLIYSVSRNTDKRPKGNIWFYDLKTHQLFAASDSSVPPIDTKSGPEMGVRAYVYTCVGGSDPGDKFVAFLEKFTPEVKRGVEEDLKRSGGEMPIGLALERRSGGVLISSPGVEKWVPKFSEEGRQIIEAGKQKGGCSHPTLVLP